MKVLQIAVGVSQSDIYKQLFLALKRRGQEFEVYVPLHHNNIKDIPLKQFPFVLYSNKIIKPYDKFIYFTKIRRMKKDVEEHFNLLNISLVHAHSLFSDGGVAYEIYKKYNLPYIVAVRGTDVDQYFKKAVHLRSYAINILLHSKYVVFLSKAYRDFVINKYVPKKYQKAVLKKTKIVPNGIDQYWLDNKYVNQKASEKELNEIRLIFVGQIIKRKNIMKILEASELVKKALAKPLKINLIGRVVDENYYKELMSKGEFIHTPYISKEELIRYYRKSSLFVMPSITETFGVVYGEAMSQGLPVIYSSGQGFDGHFEEGEVGYSVNPHDAEDIANKVILAIKNKNELKINCYKLVDIFDWDDIANTYQNMYRAL